MGIIIGIVCDSRKSIYAAIALHTVVNLSGIIINILFKESENLTIAGVALGIVSVFGMIVSTIKIMKHPVREEITNTSMNI